VNWIIDKNIRCDLLLWEKTNFSGERIINRIFPSGRQGDDPRTVAGMMLVGPVGVRVVFSVAPAQDEFWLERPWRAIEITEDNSFINRNGKRAVRVPDLDCLDRCDAVRTDPDFSVSYQSVETLDADAGWTYGRTGMLVGRVSTIRFDKRP